jgi:hypothetical protein
MKFLRSNGGLITRYYTMYVMKVGNPSGENLNTLRKMEIIVTFYEFAAGVTYHAY